ncbi:hypothetical protein [Bradyrhizobium diazoefficiens]|nr:hypothetical protein XF15B_58920 [Bradyrhizobium diazoefficiens]
MALKGLVTAFRTIVLRQLSPAEKNAVEAAQRAFREGYLRYDLRKTRTPSNILDRDKKLLHFLDELDAGIAKRQRAVLANPEFQAALPLEYERPRKLAAIFYFKGMVKGGAVSLWEAAERAELDSKRFAELEDAKGGPNGQALLARHFPSLGDFKVQSLACRFCLAVSSEALKVARTYDPDLISDAKLKESIIQQCAAILARTDDYEACAKQMAQLSGNIEPMRIGHYADIFKSPAWARQLQQLHIQRKGPEQVAKEEAQKRAAEDRRKIEKQLTFSLDKGTLDVSLYYWPALRSNEDQIALFESLKRVFAKATKVRFMHLPDFGDSYAAERSIKSMKLRQLACVKQLLWADRIGLLRSRNNGNGDVSKTMMKKMIGVLNADGNADVYTRRLGNPFEPVLPEVQKMLRANIEQEWAEYADSYQKWVGTETFSGELIRWLNEDPSDSTGWATSR